MKAKIGRLIGESEETRAFEESGNKCRMGDSPPPLFLSSSSSSIIPSFLWNVVNETKQFSRA